MRRSAIVWSFLGAALLWWGCAGGAPAPNEGPGSTVSVDVAALNLEGVGDVVWDIEVVNGRTTPSADVVWQRRLSSSGYGDGAGSASYVGPCDADPAVAENTIKVWVVGVYDAPVTTLGSFNSGSTAGAGAVTGSPVAFQNPTSTAPLTQVVTCVENSDAFVQFDVALMRPAQQGFFDIAVNFNNIFCSAKFDCCNDSGGTGCVDLDLLFNADGARDTTMVLGFACTAGARAGVETELYLDALQLDCTSPTNFDTGFGADITLNPSGPGGNQCSAGDMGGCTGVVTETGVDSDLYLFQLGVYRGLEQLTSGGVGAQKVYWNVALGVHRKIAAGPGIEDCWLKTQGTADDANGSNVVDAGTIAAGAVYPILKWEVDLGACASEPLTFGDPSAMVRTDYSTTGGAGATFAYGYGPSQAAGPFCSPECENGQCVSGGCVCDGGWHGAACDEPDNAAPIAQNPGIGGSLVDGQLLTGQYTYFDGDSDLEGTSTFQWYRADDGAGTNAAPISGAIAQTYSLTGADVGSFIGFEVVPVAQSGASPGAPARVYTTTAVVANTASQVAFTTPGTHNWTVPAGVTSISVVAVGGGGGGLGHMGSGDAGGGAGGGLAYANDIAVTPGETIVVVVGAGGAAKWATSSDAKGNDGGLSKIVQSGSDVFGAGGGKGNSRDGTVNVAGGSPFGGYDGGGTGGTSGGNNNNLTTGGGGAGGYSGNGGAGGTPANAGASGSGGGGGGGGGSNNRGSGGGGGVGIYGQGSSGAGGGYTSDYGFGGGGGSGGANGADGTNGSLPNGSPGGLYGGGGGGSDTSDIKGGAGGDGAVRIIWPGELRYFPSTRTADE